MGLQLLEEVLALCLGLHWLAFKKLGNLQDHCTSQQCKAVCRERQGVGCFGILVKELVNVKRVERRDLKTNKLPVA